MVPYAANITTTHACGLNLTEMKTEATLSFKRQVDQANASQSRQSARDTCRQMLSFNRRVNQAKASRLRQLARDARRRNVLFISREQFVWRRHVCQSQALHTRCLRCPPQVRPLGYDMCLVPLTLKVRLFRLEVCQAQLCAARRGASTRRGTSLLARARSPAPPIMHRFPLKATDKSPVFIPSWP